LNFENKILSSIYRIKIEPTKGIPTRFLGPTALPESLADMLLKQVCSDKIEHLQTVAFCSNLFSG